MESLDRELFDAGGPVPDVKLLAGRLHHAGHALACHLPIDVVFPVIDAHASIGLHGAGKGSLMHAHERAVRIDHFWHGWECRELRTGHTRRAVAAGARLVGTLMMVMRHKGEGRLGDLLAGAWKVDLQAFVRERPMKALDVGVGRSRQLHRLHP